MTWLIAIISIILIVVFWRIFAFVAVIAAIGLVVVVLYFQAESNRNEQKQKREAEVVRQKSWRIKPALVVSTDNGRYSRKPIPLVVNEYRDLRAFCRMMVYADFKLKSALTVQN